MGLWDVRMNAVLSRTYRVESESADEAQNLVEGIEWKRDDKIDENPLSHRPAVLIDESIIEPELDTDITPGNPWPSPEKIPDTSEFVFDQRTAFGQIRYYPQNEKAKALCKMLAQQTLTDDQFDDIRENLGLKVRVV